MSINNPMTDVKALAELLGIEHHRTPRATLISTVCQAAAMHISKDQAATAHEWINAPAFDAVAAEMASTQTEAGTGSRLHNFTRHARIAERAGALADTMLHAEYGGPKAASMRAEAVRVAAESIHLIRAIDNQEHSA